MRSRLLRSRNPISQPILQGADSYTPRCQKSRAASTRFLLRSGDLDQAAHVTVVDRAAPVDPHDEIAADIADVDIARVVLINNDIRGHVAHGYVARAVRD